MLETYLKWIHVKVDYYECLKKHNKCIKNTTRQLRRTILNEYIQINVIVFKYYIYRYIARLAVRGLSLGLRVSLLS